MDLLAVLLLQAQDAHRQLTAEEQSEATAMIEVSDNTAAAALWNEVGAVDGMNAGNARLGLTQTTPGTDGYWGTTTTSVTDQLRLLRDIVS